MTSIRNKEGREIQLKPQRGSNCGLYALSLALDYLYGIDYPATKGDKPGSENSLRELFKGNGQTIIGEIYDAEKFAEFVNEQFAEKGVSCSCEPFDLARIGEVTAVGGLCMVPFCVNDDGQPVDTGEGAHWCIIHQYADEGMKACQWGEVYDFSPEELQASNACIADTSLSYYGKVAGESMEYVECDLPDSEFGVEGEPIKLNSIKEIPAATLSETLAGRMVVFEAP